MKYRKKPVVIEAIPCKAAIQHAGSNWKVLPKWFRDAYEKGGMVIAHNAIIIPTLEGKLRADPDDMIICGVKGELYPCKPDIFAATYETIAIESEGLSQMVAVENSEAEQVEKQNEAKP